MGSPSSPARELLSNSVIRVLSSLFAATLASTLGVACLHPLETWAQKPPTDSSTSTAKTDRAGPVLPETRQGLRKPPSAAADNNAPPSAADPELPEADPDSIERLVWDKAPLQIAIGVGAANERSITFPAQMHIGVPHETAPLLRVQTVGRTSYVTALAPFPRTRVVAEDRASGSVILLDLIASADTHSTRAVAIVTPGAAEPRPTATTGDEAQQEAPIDMVTLTRFAAQQMYAPRRLARPHPGIRRVVVDPTPTETLYAGGGLRGVPAAQWRGDDLYVTAVVLQNLQVRPVELNPLDIRGSWRAITFQHGRLLGRGTEADETVVYLVCDRPFETCR